MGTRVTRLERGIGQLAMVGLFAALSTLALAQSSTISSQARARAAAVGHPPKSRPLDLSLPPLKLVLTPEQYQALTAQPPDDTGMQNVTVRNAPIERPVPVGTFRALGWAIIHPLDAWRILLPVQNP